MRVGAPARMSEGDCAHIAIMVQVENRFRGRRQRYLDEFAFRFNRRRSYARGLLYCPHMRNRMMKLIEQLGGVMPKEATPNKCYATCKEFADATPSFNREKGPRRWADFCDTITANFRVISPQDFGF